MTSNISSKIELGCTRLNCEDASVINFWPFATDMIAARFVTTCDLCDMWGRKSHEQGWRWWPWGEDEDEDEGENEDDDDDDDDDGGDADDADDADVADDAAAAAAADDDDGGVVVWWCGDVVMWIKIQVK